jgi:DNA replication and repair protein RecF
MHLTRIGAENFRPFARLSLDPHPRRNLFVGANAAGKTSLLEAIYALGRGHSFRGTAAEVAGRDGAHWRLAAEYARSGDAGGSIGISWADDTRRVAIDGAAAPLQELIRTLPVQILEPESHRLVEDGPVNRRRYLDWGVFHVEHRFFPAWRRYHRALKQRNGALRGGAARTEVAAWDAELAASGSELHQAREQHLARLTQRFDAQVADLVQEGPWALELDRGWPEGLALADALAASYPRDAGAGATLVGPHRAELVLRLQDVPARHRISRGQQKLAVAALLLAQAGLIAEASGRAPIVLVDDVNAELGAEFQESLALALAGYPGQVFATAIEPPRSAAWRENLSVFHVEHGSIRTTSLV